jgi:phosphopantothenoylcysteine decarboxylase/phosphopantothenate--cysteine ligase
MKIVLGVTGSVAAFKAIELGRIFIKNQIDVVPVLTKNSLYFIGKDSFESLLKTECYYEMFSQNLSQKEPIHLKILKDADAIVIAPCTANMIGKFANGIADDLLSTILLSANIQVFIAPAMHENLWNSEIVQENVKKLKSKGVIFIGPEKGELSDLKIGKGRMSEPEKIFEEVFEFLKLREKFKNKKLLLTFGRTEEDIDNVRVITNRSSGKMGKAIFDTAIKMGFEISVIKGKTDFEFDFKRLKEVRTSYEMLEAIKNEFFEFKPDFFIMNAAVSDFIPSLKEEEKIKKDKEIEIFFKKNIDILKEISKYKEKDTIFVGFALEDKDIFENAKKKLKEKNLDMIVLNTPEALSSDFTKIWILNKKGEIKEFPLLSKKEASLKIFEEIINVL